MAAGWVHQTIDLIVYGRTYAYAHRQKDAAAQIMPGMRHRAEGHERYQSFGIDWDFNELYPKAARKFIERLSETRGPDVAEERMSSDSHDFIDRTWDELSRDQRIYWEGFFAWLLYNPNILEERAGVDVFRGRIKRLIDGHDTLPFRPYRRRSVSLIHMPRIFVLESRFRTHGTG